MNKKLKPALISGIPLGIVFALPELDYLKASLNYVKLVCCALYGTSGVLAAGIYLRNLSTPPASPYGDGVVVGLLAGSFFSVADTFTRMLMRLSGYSEQTLAYMDAMGTERH